MNRLFNTYLKKQKKKVYKTHLEVVIRKVHRR